MKTDYPATPRHEVMASRSAGNPKLHRSITAKAELPLPSASKRSGPGPAILSLLVLCWNPFAAAMAAEKPAEKPARPPKPPVLEVNSKADPLKIAFISYANPQQVAKDADAIAQYLEPRLGIPVKGMLSLEYGYSSAAMRFTKADVACVDPLAFMMAHEQFGATPILLEVYAGGPRYHSCIWVRKDRDLRDLKDLRGK